MEYIVYVDSNNRNSTLYANSNSYTLHLATPIRNIAKAEVVSAMLPALASSQFISLDIEELRTPRHQVADALRRTGTSNLLTATSNTYDGVFAVVPVKVSGTYEFYNQNYKAVTEYPYPIDKLDRLTISWRNPSSGALFFDTSDLGRNMFILRFETVKENLSPERSLTLPDPVEWDSGEKERLMMIGSVAVAGLVIILSMRRTLKLPA